MTATLERIRNDIKTLDQSEIELLYLDLQTKVALPASAEDEANIEAEWDEVIKSRIERIESGTAKLIPLDEVEAEMDAYAASLAKA